MRRLKTNAWRPSLVSKVLSLRWSLLKENEIPPFVGIVPFFAHASPLFMSEASGSFCIF